jgi:hypothetical protein
VDSIRSPTKCPHFMRHSHIIVIPKKIEESHLLS